MIWFVTKRFVQAILVLVVVALIAFAMFRYLGDPVNMMVGIETSIEQRDKLREQLGLNDSVVVQFGRFLERAARFEFGISYQHRKAVSALIAQRLPATLELSLVSVILALAVGIPMGVYTALRRDGLLARIFMTVSLIGVSLPTFLIGILLILFFGVILQWLPTFGRGEVVNIGGWTTGLLTPSGLQALILPAITLAIFQMTLVVRLIRAEMLEVLRTDYIKFCRARGLRTRSIHFRHALKNTLVPVITIVGLQLGTVIAFAIITETVFQWPGMGLLFIQAVTTVDIPIMAAYLMLIATFFVIINLIVDMLYFAVDPRLRVQS
ncbi:MAG: ABC transporter permease [Gammaproteobacteria bacterium]|nr:ABC transporter permease [Gammaproteobacteria bacterium]